MSEVASLLIKAPESQLDPSMVELAKKWSDPPKAIEILQVLDFSVHGGLASSFVIQVLESELKQALTREQISIEEVIKQATWR